MYYENIRQGIFLARPNRFIAHVALADGKPSVRCADSSLRKGSQECQERYEICHVKNTGRCRELLVPGATVYLQEFDSSTRKTKFDLIAVEKPTSPHPALCATFPWGKAPFRLINMDSQAPNKVFGEWAASGAFTEGLTLLKPETTWGKSRFDFYFEAECGPSHPRAFSLAPMGQFTSGTPAPTGAQAAAPRLLRRGFVEVKGVTLEEDGAVYFPDAPTERGVKHIEELIACRAEGYEAYLCFVIQMEGVRFFSPNDRTHPAFGAALRKAAAAGVEILAYECAVTPDTLTMGDRVEIRL